VYGAAINQKDEEVLLELKNSRLRLFNLPPDFLSDDAVR
jgi:hypothetical protein